MMARQEWAGVSEKNVSVPENPGKAEDNTVGRHSVRAWIVIMLGALFIAAAPSFGQKVSVPAGEDLATAVANAPDGAVLVLEGGDYELLDTIPIDKNVTIQGYNENLCESLPTERVIRGQGDNCYEDPTDTNLYNPGFEAGDDGNWVFSSVLVEGEDASFTPPTSSDIITQEGEPYEGEWHAWFDLEPRGAEVELRYNDPIPTLPEFIEEEVRWATSVTTLCNVMDLTTESAYTLPVLAPQLVENYFTDMFPAALSADRLHIWLRVLQWSGHGDDKIEVFVNGALVAAAPGATLDTWETSGGWVRWDEAIPPVAVTPAEVRIQVTTRTDVPNPTLALIGVVNIDDIATPAVPSDTDSMNLFEYSSNLGASEFFPKAVFDLTALGMSLEVPVNTQNWVVRAGGLGAPYL
ncbi:MAG TPA: hypothetical protein ENN29_08040, partial [Candidatus Hydrogenedentes bacterium]|nr:hypothetical protein [Candidatus Hydrogenedentota bacterium]